MFEPWPKTPAMRDDSAGLAASAAAVHKVGGAVSSAFCASHLQRRLPQVIDGIVASGVPAHRIIVAGFSQGAAVALQSTYTYPARCCRGS